MPAGSRATGNQLSAVTAWPEDDRPTPTDVIDPLETCAVPNAFGHKCGERPNHEAQQPVHRCCLAGDTDDELCAHEWAEAE